METGCIRVERLGRITRITIDRPASANALDAAAQFELAAVFDGFAADPEQWVAVLTGSGNHAFCAGGDLKALARDGMSAGRPKTCFGGLTRRFDLEKPVIAAVNGLAYGGGFELALACDIIVACETARFCLPEPRRGLVALGGGILRLVRAVGEKRAMDIALTARVVSAPEALSLGFVADVVPDDDLAAAALARAEEIAQLAPLAVRGARESVLRAMEQPTLAEAMRAQLHHPSVDRNTASQDFKEGPLAFSEKRPPDWKGR